MQKNFSNNSIFILAEFKSGGLFSFNFRKMVISSCIIVRYKFSHF